MIVLGEVEWGRIDDFGGGRTEMPRLEFLAIHRFRGLRGPALLGGEGIDAGAILRAYIIALAHALGRIVTLPEGFEQPLIGNLRRIVDHQHHLIVAGAAGAHLLVGRVGRVAARVADGGDVNAVAQFPKLALGAPEATHAEHRRLEAPRIRPLERPVKDEMLARGRNRRRAAGQRLGG